MLHVKAEEVKVLLPLILIKPRGVRLLISTFAQSNVIDIKSGQHATIAFRIFLQMSNLKLCAEEKVFCKKQQHFFFLYFSYIYI